VSHITREEFPWGQNEADGQLIIRYPADGLKSSARKLSGRDQKRTLASMWRIKQRQRRGSRARAPTAAEPGDIEPTRPSEPVPPTASGLVAKTDDLEALRTAVIDAAGVSFGLWISYLFVLFYFLIAAGGVTHRDLFFESPVKLPFLYNIDLPLKGFFWLGPTIFLIAHVYVLLHLAMLASRVRAFDSELRARIDDPKVRAELRRQLPINMFVQFLAGPREVRDSIQGLLLWLIAFISIVIGPVALLVFFQLQFLAYHEEWISWWQRSAVAADLALLWTLWPRVGLPGGRFTRAAEAGRRGVVETMQRIATMAVMILITAVSVPLVFTLATFPVNGSMTASDRARNSIQFESGWLTLILLAASTTGPGLTGSSLRAWT
jgi:hypothetical protein